MASISGMFCFVVTAAVLAEAAKTNYCDPKLCEDEDGPHTMCKYTSDKPAAACKKVIRVGCTKDDKKIIVEKHNTLRQKVASGKVTGQPAAVSMPNLSWDDELETIAQRWTNQCNWDHDECRNVERFGVGQNMARTKKSEDNVNVEKMIQGWFDEVKDLNPKEIFKFTGDSPEDRPIGHYTQLVWADTIKVGCGCITFLDAKTYVTFLTCNYGPSGNVEDDPIYKTKQ